MDTLIISVATSLTVIICVVLTFIYEMRKLESGNTEEDKDEYTEREKEYIDRISKMRKRHGEEMNDLNNINMVLKVKLSESYHEEET